MTFGTIPNIQALNLKSYGCQFERPEVHEVAATSNHPVNGDGDDYDGAENEILPQAAGGAAELASLRGIESYLEPFERALLKVRNFCDALRNVISDEVGG